MDTDRVQPARDPAGEGQSAERAPRRLASTPRRMIIALMIGIGVLALLSVTRFVGGIRTMFGDAEGKTALTQDIVVDQVRAVAKLVSTEMTVRDVVTYRNTRYGSTKQALIVVTGKILAGIDLEEGMEVKIDSVQRLITITLPEAKVLAVDIVQLRTYDEQRGLWNPFTPSDRDAIYGEVRRQLNRTAADMGIVAKANESAARMLETMFSVDGYTAGVRFGPVGGVTTPLEGAGRP